MDSPTETCAWPQYQWHLGAVPLCWVQSHSVPLGNGSVVSFLLLPKSPYFSGGWTIWSVAIELVVGSWYWSPYGTWCANRWWWRSIDSVFPWWFSHLRRRHVVLVGVVPCSRPLLMLLLLLLLLFHHASHLVTPLECSRHGPPPMKKRGDGCCCRRRDHHHHHDDENHHHHRSRGNCFYNRHYDSMDDNDDGSM